MLTVRGQGFPISPFQVLTVSLLGSGIPEASHLGCSLVSANSSAVSCLVEPYPMPGSYSVILAANGRQVRLPTSKKGRCRIHTRALERTCIDGDSFFFFSKGQDIKRGWWEAWTMTDV